MLLGRDCKARRSGSINIHPANEEDTGLPRSILGCSSQLNRVCFQGQMPQVPRDTGALSLLLEELAVRVGEEKQN